VETSVDVKLLNSECGDEYRLRAYWALLNLLQCVAVCCSVLQYVVAVCCSVLQCVAVCSSVLQYVAVSKEASDIDCVLHQ